MHQLTLDEILVRLPNAGRKKKKQLMTKLFRRLGSGRVYKRLRLAEKQKSDISCFSFEEGVVSVFGYDFFSNSGEVIDTFSGESVPTDFAEALKKALR